MDVEAFREAERRYWNRLGLDPVERVVGLASGTDLRLHVVGEGPPVLILHGVNNSGIMVAGIAALLPDHQCFVIDRPGCGLSDPPPRPAGINEYFEYVDGLVPHVLDALGLQSASIVSTSMGGLFAARAAARHPDRVAKLAHLGWSMGAPLERLPMVMRPANTRLGATMMARMPVPRLGVKPMLKSIGLRRAFEKGNVPDELVDAMYALAKHTDTMKNELRVGPLMLERMQDVVIPPSLLSKIAAPGLFLWGTDDPMGSPDVAAAFVRSIPGARLHLVDDAGHAPWLDEPDLVRAEVTAFLSA